MLIHSKSKTVVMVIGMRREGCHNSLLAGTCSENGQGAHACDQRSKFFVSRRSGENVGGSI